MYIIQYTSELEPFLVLFEVNLAMKFIHLTQKLRDDALLLHDSLNVWKLITQTYSVASTHSAAA